MTKKIEYLFMPVPKKIAPALQKIRFSAYESNLFWVYCDLTYGSKEKKKFAKIKYDTIKKRTGREKPHISRTHKKLKNRRILLRTDAGWGINENIHYFCGDDIKDWTNKVWKQRILPILGAVTIIRIDPIMRYILRKTQRR